MSLPKLHLPFLSLFGQDSLKENTLLSSKPLLIHQIQQEQLSADNSTNNTSISSQDTPTSESLPQLTPQTSVSPNNEDNIPDFPQDLYNRIESFFDQEKLHIVCPQTPSGSRHTTLKVCPNLQRLRSMCGSSLLSTEDTRSSINEEDVKGLAMPSFLLKRTQSSSQIDRPGRPGLAIKRGVNSEMAGSRSKFLLIKNLEKEEEPHVEC